MRFLGLLLITALLATGCIRKIENKKTTDKVSPVAATVYEGENHLQNIRQLTFGGQNAEAYFSYDGSELIFQATTGEMECDVIYRMNIDGSDLKQISSGNGVTTCSFISPDNLSLIYASTHLSGEPCPPKPDMSLGYVWPLYKEYEIFKTNPNGSNIIQLTKNEVYDAEAVFSPSGDKIIFTSLRSGDLELYLMNADGSDVEQLTDRAGYDGGAFFSYDARWIVWRASRPKGDELKNYRELLEENLIKPGKLEIYIMNLKDRKPIQLTDNGKANFAPYFHPDGRHIIYASNMNDPKGRNFDLFMIEINSKEIKQITFNETFDGFPMFSHDGKKLVFSSNRDNKVRGETNIFIADWVW